MAGDNHQKLAAGQSAPKLQGQQPTAPGGPDGWEKWIAFGVAYNLYGSDGSVDVNRDISGDASVDPDALAFKINQQARYLAGLHGYQWTLVGSRDVQNLRTVMDLENLVMNNLSPATGS
jgi:hypothetical protein